MKVVSVLAFIGLAISLPVGAEPYAEWGVLGKSTPLQELDPDAKVPDASDVPIPPPPGAKFIGVSGNRFCTLALRTERSVEEVCAYYHSKLASLGFSQVDADGLETDGCEIFKDGNTETDLGVLVSKNEDPMFVANGSTHVVMTYPLESGVDCSK